MALDMLDNFSFVVGRGIEGKVSIEVVPVDDLHPIGEAEGFLDALEALAWGQGYAKATMDATARYVGARMQPGRVV